MAKVICALLRYTEDEKILILEHEKLRQTVKISFFSEKNFCEIFRFVSSFSALVESDEMSAIENLIAEKNQQNSFLLLVVERDRDLSTGFRFRTGVLFHD